MQTRNKYGMHVFFKDLLIFHIFVALLLFFNSVSGQGEQVVKQKVEKHG